MNPASPEPARVLVLAPRFPSINQPWVDTYLEQLQRTGIPFAVATEQEKPGVYHDKVDSLGFLRRTVTASFRPSRSVLHVVYGLVSNPGTSWRLLSAAGRGQAGPGRLRNRVGRVLRAFNAAHAVRYLRGLELIHAHSLGMAYDFLPWAGVRSIPLVLTFHGLQPKGVPQVPVYKRKAVFQHAIRVLVNTEFARDHAIELGCEPDKVNIIPQGLPLEDFPYTPHTRPGCGESVRLLTVGRYQRDKGQGYALLALRRLLDSGVQAEWNFVGVGPDKVRLRRLADRLGLAQQVVFRDGISTQDLRELYRDSHIFVFPSLGSRSGRLQHVETQGVVLQEAQASGCIPVATRVGGVPEVVNHGRDGLLVRDRSHRAIAGAVEQLLSLGETEWSRYQESGRRNVEERFSADVVGKKMAEILRGVMREP